MRSKLLPVLGLVLIAAAPASAYDTLEEDFATCTQGSGKVSNAEIVEACTRLIDNSQVENETTGFFYALRASSNTDKESNCRDAHKALELLQSPDALAGAKQLQENNC